MNYKQRLKEYECIKQHAFQAHEIIKDLVNEYCYKDSKIAIETKSAIQSAALLLNAIYLSSKKTSGNYRTNDNRLKP